MEGTEVVERMSMVKCEGEYQLSLLQVIIFIMHEFYVTDWNWEAICIICGDILALRD